MNPQRIQLRRYMKKLTAAVVASVVSPLVALFVGVACVPGFWSEIFKSMSEEWKR